MVFHPPLNASHPRPVSIGPTSSPPPHLLPSSTSLLPTLSQSTSTLQRTITKSKSNSTSSSTSPNPLARTLEPFVCGGTSAIFASILIHPIDLAKVRMQIHAQLNPNKPVPSFPNIIKSQIKAGGLSSVYRGLDASIGRQMVYGTARIGLHRKISDMLLSRHADGSSLNFGEKALSGMASGAIAVCIGTPFDIALVRLQADSMAPVAERRNYKNVFDALIRTTNEEGVLALYKGLAPNILRGMSMNVGMMACYDEAKEQTSKYITRDDPSKPSVTTKIIASSVAGFTAALFSLPFDLIKSRLMAQKVRPDGTFLYAGVVDCASQILKNEGPRGFFTGFTAYYSRCAPHAMVILMSIETVTSKYRTAFVKD